MGHAILWAQAALAAIALCLSLFLPRADQAGVLVPLWSRAEASVGAWAVGHGAQILQRGQAGGSVVIQIPSIAIAWQALRDGMIVLPAAAVGCAQLAKNQGS
ncbi:hypothetical protein B2G71_15205 [Novosphingobium sp. PC22D]|nr:hypothetical protein B2G71_15205 [Novosphingobium sp. PC22D]